MSILILYVCSICERDGEHCGTHGQQKYIFHQSWADWNNEVESLGKHAKQGTICSMLQESKESQKNSEEDVMRCLVALK